MSASLIPIYGEAAPKPSIESKLIKIIKKIETDNTHKADSLDERTQDKPSSSTTTTRPKEAIEAVPVQNQAAAQKLPKKMSHRNHGDKHSRGRQFGGKGRQEEEPDGKREKPGQSLQLEVPVQE